VLHAELLPVTSERCKIGTSHIGKDAISNVIPVIASRSHSREVRVKGALHGADLVTEVVAVDGGVGGSGGQGEAAGRDGAGGCALGYEGAYFHVSS
jgi:hypothetical protein